MKVRRLGQLLLSMLLLAALFYYIDVGMVWNKLLETDPFIYSIGFLLFLATYLPSGYRWKLLSDASDHPVNLMDATKTVAVSYSLNKLLPWNTGDLARSKIAERYVEVESHSRILGALAMERVLDMVALTSVIVLGMAFAAPEIFREVLWVLIPVLSAIALGSYFFVREPELLLSSMPENISGFVEEAFIGFRAVELRELTLSAVASLAKWWLEAVVFFILAVSIAAPMGFWEGAVANSVISLVSALPISPAGLGPADAAGTGVLSIAGVTTEDAFTVIVLWRTLGVGVQGLIGALIYGFDL